MKQKTLEHLTQEIHEEGKVNKSSGKAEEREAQILAKPLETFLAQPKNSESTQWEKAANQGAEPVFKLEMAPNQSQEKQVLIPTQPNTA